MTVKEEKTKHESTGFQELNQRVQAEKEISLISEISAEIRDLSCLFSIFVSCQSSHVFDNQLMQKCNLGGEKGRQPSASQLSIGQTTLGCTKQPAHSQRRSDRARRCSRRTRGPPSASLLRSKSPSSPRRRSSEGGGEEEEADKKKRRLRRGRRSFKEFYCHVSHNASRTCISELQPLLERVLYSTSKCVLSCSNFTLRLLGQAGFPLKLKLAQLTRRWLQIFPRRWRKQAKA